jgi:hypothetical protein
VDIGYVAMQIRKLEMSKSLLMRLHMFHGWNKWHFNFNGLVYSMLLLVTNSDYNAHSWTDKKATYVNNSKNLNGSPYDRLKQRWSLIKESFVTERRFLFFFFQWIHQNLFELFQRKQKECMISEREKVKSMI